MLFSTLKSKQEGPSLLPTPLLRAFAALFDGDRWMIYRNAVTDVLHWDFSALGRFISFAVIDNQATGSIKMNLTQVRELGQLWSSSPLINFADAEHPKRQCWSLGGQPYILRQ